MTSAAAEYRAERDAQRLREPVRFLAPLPEDDPPPPMDMNEYGSGSAEKSAQELPIEMVCAASLAGKPVPERRWLVKDLIPLGVVTLLYGDGAVGKSLLGLQLAVATSTASDWAGAMPEPGPAIFLSAEDDMGECHRRLADIMAGGDMADLGDLHIIPRAGLDAVLGAPDRAGIIAPTPLWQAVVARIEQVRPRLVIIDTLADAFGGNEIMRAQARQFVGLLRSVAVDADRAVVVLGHPSLSGLASGSGTSGSTGWSNAVRSRLYLDRATAEDGTEPDKRLRVLRLMKANYAEPGIEIRLKWDAGRFRLDGLGAGGFDRMAAEQRAERVFLDLLKQFTVEGREVSHKRSPSYAPIIFAKHPGGNGINKQAFEAAMDRLFAAGAIKAETYGPPSRQYSRILASEAGA